MFTGIIESSGGATFETIDDGRQITIACPFASDLSIGDSVAIDGVCTTVTELSPSEFTVYAAKQTCEITSLGTLSSGHRFNLERAMLSGSRLDGHFVYGHVDGVSELVDVLEQEGSYLLRFSLDSKLSRYMVQKGSVCLNGISLTLYAVEDDSFQVMIIPHTWEMTNLSRLQKGDAVNIEVDMLAKYIEKLTAKRV